MSRQTTRTNAHRTVLGLAGTVAALALTAGSVAAQDTGVDPEPNIEAPRITGVAPREGQTRTASVTTGFEATILNVQRAASQGMIPAVFAEDLIADIRAQHKTDLTPTGASYEAKIADLAAGYVHGPAPAVTGHEATILNVQRAASQGMIPAVFAHDVIADIQSRRGVVPATIAYDATFADRSTD